MNRNCLHACIHHYIAISETICMYIYNYSAMIMVYILDNKQFILCMVMKLNRILMFNITLFHLIDLAICNAASNYMYIAICMQ